MGFNYKCIVLLLVLVGQNIFSQTQHSKDMELKTLEAFQIVGISARTINKDGQSMQDIGKLWEKFWGMEAMTKIPNRVDDTIYAVYTDYESDANGYYTVIIGYSVKTLANIPEGMTGITVEKNSYQKFTSKGKMPDAIVNTWLKIWQDATLNRAYKTDFTVHGKKYFDGDNAEVETYISVN